MIRTNGKRTQASGVAFIALFVFAPVFLLVSCGQPADVAPPRPVTVLVVRPDAGHEIASIAGQIAPAHQITLSFQLGGRLIERDVDVGDRVRKGQVIARVDPRDQRNAVLSAKAALAAAQSHLIVAHSAFDRQIALIKESATSKSQYDQAHDEFENAQAQLLSAQSTLSNAQDALGYDELKSDIDGVVVSKGAEPGEVVQPGQTIVQVAEDGGIDAVFDVSDEAIRTVPSNYDVLVILADDPNIKAIGHVREIAKIALANPPAAMRLGATVTGQVKLPLAAGFSIPASALTEHNNHPAVWIVKGSRHEVELRTVQISRFDEDDVLVSKGLASGDVVVTAGVQELYPGQAVRILGTRS
jgi:membrane fusion protein, multidrug efflux system